MSGDFEDWDNSPSQNKAPKPVKTLKQIHHEGRKRSNIFIYVGLGVVILLVALWAWHRFHP
jgi:uncharacterized membrane protein YukC